MPSVHSSPCLELSSTITGREPRRGGYQLRMNGHLQDSRSPEKIVSSVPCGPSLDLKNGGTGSFRTCPWNGAHRPKLPYQSNTAGPISVTSTAPSDKKVPNGSSYVDTSLCVSR